MGSGSSAAPSQSAINPDIFTIPVLFLALMENKLATIGKCIYLISMLKAVSTLKRVMFLLPGMDSPLLILPLVRSVSSFALIFGFPELSRILALRGAQIIFVPGAFNMTTGPAHWETHFRSRAIDNQVFMMGCAPARAAFGYQSYGHSILVNPWGTILQQLEFEPGILLEKIDLNEVNSIREQLPLMSARRTDKYVLEEIE